ncbi:MAG: hypothetical protein AB7K09_06950 [Planctomycetota bacterium]
MMRTWLPRVAAGLCVLPLIAPVGCGSSTPSNRPTEVIRAAPAADASPVAPAPASPAPSPDPMPDTVRIVPDDLPPLVAFELPDQFDATHRVIFPTDRVTILAAGDRDGSPQLDGWTVPLVEEFGDRIDIIGIAIVTGIDPLFRPFVRGVICQQRPVQPVLLDWDGRVSQPLDCEPACANLFVVRRDGRVRMRALGAATPTALRAVSREVRLLLGLREDGHGPE